MARFGTVMSQLLMTIMFSFKQWANFARPYMLDLWGVERIPL